MLARLMFHFKMGTMRQTTPSKFSANSSANAYKLLTAPAQVAEPLIASVGKTPPKFGPHVCRKRCEPRLLLGGIMLLAFAVRAD